MKKFFSLVICTLFFFLMINVISAKEPRTVTIAFPNIEDSRLYIVYEDGSLGGMMYEYFECLGRCAGWSIEYIVDDMDTLYEKFSTGEIDIMGSTYYLEGFQEFADYPAIPSGFNYFCLAALEETTDILSGDYSTFENKTVAITQGQIRSGKFKTLESFCTSNDININFKIYDNIETPIQLLKTGEVDMILMGSSALPEGLRQILRFSDEPYYTIVSKGNKEILRELNSSLYTIHSMSFDYGTELYEKYFGNTSALSNAFTAEEKKYLQEKGTLRIVIPRSSIGLEEDIQKIGNYNCLDYDIAEYFCKLIGINAEYVLADTTEEAIEMLLENKADVLPILFNYANSTFNYDNVHLYPYNYLTQFEVEDIYASDKNILAIPVYQETYFNHNFLDSYDEVIFCDSITECLKYVSDGTASKTILDTFSVQYYLLQEEYQNLTITSSGQNLGSLNLATYSDDTNLLTILEKALLYIRSSDINDLIYQRMLTNQSQNSSFITFVKRNIITIFIIAVIIIAIILFCISFAIISHIKQKSMLEVLEKQNKNEKALNAALQQANVATEAKSRFLSNISHEMRTPLNGISGMLTLMEYQNSKGKNEDYLKKAKLSCEQLLSLINSVLDMSRIESGKETIQETTFQIANVVEELKAMLEFQAQLKHIHLEFCSECDLHKSIIGDEMKLKQILVNVIGNAIKFTEEGGNVIFTIIEKNTDYNGTIFYLFECMDTGIGMTKEFMNSMFQPFSRSKEAEQMQIKGTGLGLSVIKGLVDIMCGTIDVESEEKKGSLFRITLPFSLDTKVKTENLSNSSDKNKAENTFSIKGKHILIVEDNALNLEIAVEFLHILELDIETASNGKEAVEIFSSSSDYYYDAILMDIQMPIMDGYEATKRIRNLNRTDSDTIPIIALTANAFKEDIEKALSCGMNGHIAKPIDIENLRKILLEHLSS